MDSNLNGNLSFEELLFNTVQHWKDDTRLKARTELLQNLHEVTLFADTENEQPDAVSSIQVPMQRTYTCTTYPVLPRCNADRPCASFDAAGFLSELNRILRTSKRDTRSQYSLFDAYVSMGYDFGTAFGLLRPFWHESMCDMIDKVQICQEKDQQMRQLSDSRINKPKTPPRRVWDLYSNRVVPYWVIQSPKKIWAISHAWMDEEDRSDVLTPINGYEWPVPIPKGTSLDLIRIEMLNWGAEYVWLDVLCLRQKGGQREDLREEEWKLDVPTIGHVYLMATRVVYYFSGLGLPFSFGTDSLESKRCWFNRAWTLQEISRDRIVGGITDGNSSSSAMQIDGEDHHAENRLRTLYRKLGCFRNLHASGYSDYIFDALAQMQDRVSQNPVDKVAGLAFLLESKTIPAYYETQSVEDAWAALVTTMQKPYRAQLLFLYPSPGNGDKSWRPSWKQVMTEDVLSIGNDPDLCAEVRWDDKTKADQYTGHWIPSGWVRGLDVADPEGGVRHGELTVRGQGRRSKPHKFQIIATHQCPIPEDRYTLLSSTGLQWQVMEGHWAVGRMQVRWKFEKVSVFEIPEYELQRLNELHRLNTLARWSCVTLS
ncbi:hypothetical protein DFS33DRAFT_1382325 [Desarmillaria ectypa]|nr:hypothetical protein DFS33DRAFT_1382325 [Desarmillaria ectypa]